MTEICFKLWINNDQIKRNIKHDGYSGTSESNANIVVFKQFGVLHSAKRNADGTYNDNTGIMTAEYNRSLSDTSRRFVDVSNYGRTAFYSKGSSNRVSSTSAGTVQGGLKIIESRKDKRDFRKSLRN